MRLDHSITSARCATFNKKTPIGRALVSKVPHTLSLNDLPADQRLPHSLEQASACSSSLRPRCLNSHCVRSTVSSYLQLLASCNGHLL